MYLPIVYVSRNVDDLCTTVASHIYTSSKPAEGRRRGFIACDGTVAAAGGWAPGAAPAASDAVSMCAVLHTAAAMYHNGTCGAHSRTVEDQPVARVPGRTRGVAAFCTRSFTTLTIQRRFRGKCLVVQQLGRRLGHSMQDHAIQGR
jgi:hypothetical protein